MQGKEPAHDPAAERLSPMQRAMACRTTFKLEYPDVRLSNRQGSPRELAERVISGEADIAIATETLDRYPETAGRACCSSAG